jgi:hypothetical protein
LESATKFQARIAIRDFAVMSPLKEFNYGELLQRLCEVYFSGCINELYALHYVGRDFFVKINRFMEPLPNAQNG